MGKIGKKRNKPRKIWEISQNYGGKIENKVLTKINIDIFYI